MSHVDLKPSPAYLRVLLQAVKTLIKQHPDEAPPGFREDFEAGNFFKASVRAGRAEEELRVLDKSLFPIRPTKDNPVRRPQFHARGWDRDLEVMDILHQLAAVVIGLIARWNFPSFDGEIIIHHAPGFDLENPTFKQFMAEQPAGTILKPEVVPLITDGEYKTLIWVRDRLAAALAWDDVRARTASQATVASMAPAAAATPPAGGHDAGEAGAGGEGDKQTVVNAKKRRVPSYEAESLVPKFIKKNPNFKNIGEVASVTGASQGAVQQTLAWRLRMANRQKTTIGRRAKMLQLKDEILAVCSVGGNDPAKQAALRESLEQAYLAAATPEEKEEFKRMDRDEKDNTVFVHWREKMSDSNPDG